MDGEERLSVRLSSEDIVLLNRAGNGALEAILVGGTVTALRTGAVGGLAAR